MDNENNQTLSVFLSHVTADKPAIRDLRDVLVHYDVDVWFDEERLLPGQEWDLEIMEAVQSSDVIIICLSKNSITKEGYFQKEIRQALDKAEEKPDGTIYIIPLKLEECDVPKRLQKWQWVNLFQEGGYQKLLDSLRTRADRLGRLPIAGFSPPKSPYKRDSSKTVKIFVDRQEFIQLIRNAIHRLRGLRRLSEPIINIYGGYGTGKSTVLQMIQEECERAKVPNTFIKLQLNSKSYSENPTLLISEMMTHLQIGQDGSTQRNELKQMIESSKTLYNSGNDQKSKTREFHYSKPSSEWQSSIEMASLFLKEIEKMKPAVFLLDDLDSANIELITWLEEALIEPLLTSSKSIIVICTSKRDWRWKTWSIRRWVKNLYLGGLSEDDFIRCIKINLPKAASIEPRFLRSVYKATNGIPGILPLVIEEIDRINSKANFTVVSTPLFIRKLASQIYNRFIFEGVFDSLPEDIQYICDELALARKFDLRFIRELFKMVEGDYFQNWGTKDYLDLINEMSRNEVVYWDAGYKIVQTVSHPIRDYYRVNHPGYYAFMNRCILTIYKNWLNGPLAINSVKSYASLIIEELYHEACLNNVILLPQQKDLIDLFRERLEVYSVFSEDEFDNVVDSLDHLEYLLEHDFELSEMTGFQTADKLKSIIKKFRTNLIANNH